MARASKSSGSQSAPSDNLWSKCPSCREISFRKEVERNLNVCPRCGFHYRLTVAQRLVITVDRASWHEEMADLAAQDPLHFVDTRAYTDRLDEARARSGRNDAVATGVATIEGHRTAIALMDFAFMGGSMGIVVGEKLGRLFELAVDERIPAVVFSSSGGARMQEGILSLAQMARVSAAVARMREARLPYISVMCDPTTGGVAASFAMLGDVNLAEPGALIGFAGRRVIEQTSSQELPEGFQRAEFLLEHGMLDAIVTRQRMRPVLAELLDVLGRPPRRAVRASRRRAARS